MKSKKNTYDIEKKDNEIELYFNIRKIFIDTLKPKNEKQFKLYEMYSNILINKIFLKCGYEKKTEKIIKDFMAKHKKKLLNV